MNKVYEFHSIANIYPMMDKQEFSNLVGSMEDDGYMQDKSITLFEGKILDGRNRYKAAQEAEVQPLYIEFTGNYAEALELARRDNIYRRNISKAQKAMVAAFEVKKSREEGSVKNLSVKNASLINASSVTYVKKALRIAEENMTIATNVFDGNMSMSEAEYRINEIQRLQEPDVVEIETVVSSTDTQTQEIIEEFQNDVEAAASRMLDLQTNYKNAMEELQLCQENCPEYTG